MKVVLTDGRDIGGDIQRWAEEYGLPPTLLAALCKAESELEPHAARWGDWPDVSFGLTQVTVATAAGLGIGDGSNTPENVLAVRDVLWTVDGALKAGAHYLAHCWDLALGHQDRALMALVAYNAGHIPSFDAEWWDIWASNVSRYREALLWADGLM